MAAAPPVPTRVIVPVPLCKFPPASTATPIFSISPLSLAFPVKKIGPLFVVIGPATLTPREVPEGVTVAVAEIVMGLADPVVEKVAKFANP